MPGTHDEAGGILPDPPATAINFTWEWTTEEVDMATGGFRDALYWFGGLCTPDAAVQRRLEREARDAEARQKAAGERSRALLRACLSEAQWASYENRGWFELTGSLGNRWRIRRDHYSGNVFRVLPRLGYPFDHTVRVVKYCAHPGETLPLADMHLAQALAIASDEEQFSRTAVCYGERNWGLG